MEFKGTKAPWKVTFHRSLNDAREVSCIQNESIDNLPTDLHIMNSYFVEHSEIHRANALLISKSPEMLEMLQECIDTIAEITPQQKKYSEKVKQLIKEATEI